MAEDPERKKRVVRRVLRKIFPAYFALLLTLSAGLIVITFFGNPNAGQASAQLDLPQDVSALPLDKADGHAAPTGHGEDAHGAHPPAHGDGHAAEHGGGHDAGHEAAATHGEKHDAGDKAGTGDGHAPHGGQAAPEAVPSQTYRPAQELPQIQRYGLTERVEQGYLPRIASDGTMPMEAYAGTRPKGNLPEIAILIGHLGISEDLTKNAEKLLPPGVSFAFSPYARELDTLVRKNRQRGHEVLLEMPMEPPHYPENDAGPYTLLVKNTPQTNLQQLIWVMSRTGGYTGLSNAQGGKFLTDKKALVPVLQFLARRGLLFFEAGRIAGSRGGAAARATGLAYGRTDIEIDKELTPRAIDAALAELVTLAKRHGKASGYALPYPLVIDRMNLWSKSLKRKGVVLAPISAVVSHQKP